MSAFVIDKATMDKCVTTLCATGSTWSGRIIPLFDGIDTGEPDAMTKIGRRLFAMNIVACEERYPDCRGNPDNLPGPCDSAGRSTAMDIAAAYAMRQPRFQVPMSKTPLIEGYKALSCLQYQCNEGHVSSTGLYKELERAINAVACAIVENLPEYEKARWG